MRSFLETDLRTIVLRTLSNRLTPVMMRYAQSTKVIMKMKYLSENEDTQKPKLSILLL